MDTELAVMGLDGAVLLAILWNLNAMSEQTCLWMRIAYWVIVAGVVFHLVSYLSPHTMGSRSEFAHDLSDVTMSGGLLLLIVFDRRSRRRVCCRYLEPDNDRR